MLDPKLAEVNTVNSLGELEKLKVADINACDEKEDYGDFSIEYPYEITIKDSKGKIVMKEKTQGTLGTKNWNKKFYIKETESGSEFVAYSKYMSLLALITILRKRNGELPTRINLNELVGFEFDGVVIRREGYDPFIDWVGTFEANGIEVPTVEQLKGTTSTPKPEEKSVKKSAWN